MSIYPPDGWTVVTGTWNTHLSHSPTGGIHGGAYLEFSPTDAVAAEIESTDYFAVNKSRYYDVSAIIGASGATNLGSFLTYVDWYNDAESLVSTTTVSTTTIGGGHTGAGAQREGAQVQAPATAVLAKLRLKQNVDTVSTANAVRVHDTHFTLAPAFWQASRITTDQTGIATATWTDVVYNSEDAANAANLATGTGIVTVYEPGCYQINAAAAVGSLGDGKLAVVGVSVNGATTPIQGVQIPTGAASTVLATVSCMVRLAAQDTVKVRIYHDHGSNRDVILGATNTWFNGVRCGM
jgi:hypothetical protein